MLEEEHFMKRRQTGSFVCWWVCWFALLVGIAEAQASGNSRLQIRLRASDGTAVAGEQVILERLPEEEPMPCVTDSRGECAWRVRRGLYQVLFTRPLDDISTLAVAEGGLRGLGITVGDEDITYHFTFHSDGRVYFDAAPEAAVPSPIIPEGDDLHGGAAPTPVLPAVNDEPVKETPTPEPADAPDTAVDTASGSSWRLILFIGGGLVIGGVLHLWSRQRAGGQGSGGAGEKESRSPAPLHPRSPASSKEFPMSGAHHER